MGNDQSVVEKYNTDAASGEEFYSAGSDSENYSDRAFFSASFI